MRHQITLLPQQVNIEADHGGNLLQVLRCAGVRMDAPCGGNGRCGKCRVLVDGAEQLACQTTVCQDMTVTLPQELPMKILAQGAYDPAANGKGYALAFDIGTTTLAGFLMFDGRQIGQVSRPNPQAAFGADVVSRIQGALKGHMDRLTGLIREALTEITLELCQEAAIAAEEIKTVCIVGNPAMQQIFLGILPDNLAKIPFSPILTQGETRAARDYLPCCKKAKLLIVPNISGFVGADTVACVLATKLDQEEVLTLLVDIGTNGEMVLGNRHRMVACSTAAGPALEGANISCGMTARPGAIDHVWLEDEKFQWSVIGGGQATGICGSGLVDAVAAALDAGMLNQRGKILTESGVIPLAGDLFLTQEDIRQVQLAKGAIAAGIRLMAAHLSVPLEEIRQVYLAGAFGSFLRKASACRIGLLPPVLEEKIQAVGNGAGSGAQWIAADEGMLARAQQIREQTEHLDLATLPRFPREFAKMMMFEVEG